MQQVVEDNILRLALSYTLIRSKRRSLSLQVSKEGLLVVRAPMRMSVNMIEEFISRKRDWVEKHQKKIESRWRRKVYTENEIQEAKVLLKEYLIPRIHTLWEWKNLQKFTSIKITKSERRWWSCSAKNGLCFSYRLAEYLPQNLSSWGTKDLLWISWAISKADSSYRRNDKSSTFIDAIIIHELAHLREKNHQKPFWNLVYGWMPEYDERIKYFL